MHGNRFLTRQLGGGGLADEAIGTIALLSGAAVVIRGSETRSLCCGDALFEKDIIETEADGTVTIAFSNGTLFTLSNGARMALDEFVCDSDGALSTGLFSLVRGGFAFITEKIAERGCLFIDTPMGRIRSGAKRGGMGFVTFAGLTFALINDLRAAFEPRPYLDDDQYNFYHLDSGVLEITTTTEAVPRVFHVDDPELMLVLQLRGAAIAAEFVRNSSSDMALQLQYAQQVFDAYVSGQHE